MDDNNAIVNGFEFKFGNYEYTFIIKGGLLRMCSLIEQKKRSSEGRGFVRKSSPSAFVIGRNDWIVGKINHIGGLQNGQVHL